MLGWAKEGAEGAFYSLWEGGGDVSEQGNCSGDLKEDRLSAWTRGLVTVVDRVRLVEGLAANAQDSKEAGGRSQRTERGPCSWRGGEGRGRGERSLCGT